MKILKEVLNYILALVFFDLFFVVMMLLGVAAGDVSGDGWPWFWWIQAHFIVVGLEFIRQWISSLLLLF